MRTKIKLCGLFRPEDMEYVNRAKPDYAGFILTPGYRRSIAREQAFQFRQKLDPEIPAAGVFVNASREDILFFLRENIIQMVQLHGEETEEDIRYLKAVSGKPVMKAVRVRKPQDAEAWLDSEADYLLFDSGTGSGQTFDWNLLGQVTRDFFLAGGLNSGNLQEAIKRLHPYAVDVSSGVETDGVKDERKIIEMMRLVRGGE